MDSKLTMYFKQVSIILVVCLFCQSVLLWDAPYVHAEEENEATENFTFNVTEYGANPGGIDDSAPGVWETVKAAKEFYDAYVEKNGKAPAITIEFPKGRYDFYPDKIEGKTLYVSNTMPYGENNAAQGTWDGANEKTDARYKNKYIGILIEDMENITIEGNGSMFMYHGNMSAFTAIGCKNAEFRNFLVDYDCPWTVDTTIVEVDYTLKTAVIKIPECYTYRVSNNNILLESDKSPYNNQPYWSNRSVLNTPGTRGNEIRVLDITDNVWLDLHNPGQTYLTNVESIADNGDHTVTITYNSNGIPNNVRAGYCYQNRDLIRRTPVTFLWKNEGIRVQNIHYYYCHGFGIVAQNSKDVMLNGLTFGVPKETGRTSGGFADFMQISGCGGEVTIDGCLFQNPQDDPINIHGTYNYVSNITSNGSGEARKKITVRFRHDETLGFPNFFLGDTVEFCGGDGDGDTRPYNKKGQKTIETSTEGEEGIFQTKVVSYEGPDGRGRLIKVTRDSNGNLVESVLEDDITNNESKLREMTLELEDALPEGINASNGNGTRIENISYIPTAINIRNSTFKECGPRAILLKARSKILVENNLFDGLYSFNILVEDTYQSWMESGRVLDMTIRGNTFTRGIGHNSSREGAGGHSYILVQEQSGVTGLHKNITIENNTFYMGGDGNVSKRGDLCRAVTVRRTQGVNIRNNNILWLDPNLNISFNNTEKNLNIGEVDSIVVNRNNDNNVSGDATMLNITGKTSNDAPIVLDNCSDVVVEGNIYDEGMNARINGTANTTNDTAATNTDNKQKLGRKICYESSDTNVIKVTAEGQVRAVGTGTAEVTAYVVTMGRDGDPSMPNKKYSSINKVSYTVGSDTIIGPKAVSIRGVNKAASQGNAEFEATVLMNDETDFVGDLNWRVLDALNNDNAIPDNNGVAQFEEGQTASGVTANSLSFHSNGVVLPEVTTNNGISARGIVSVQVNPYVPSDCFTYETPGNKSRVSARAEGIALKSSAGGFYQRDSSPQNLISIPFDASIWEGEQIDSFSPVDDNWEVEVTIDGTTNYNYQAVGLAIFKDEDNYLMAHRQRRANANQSWISLVKEIDRTANEKGAVNTNPDNRDLSNISTVSLKIRKENDTAKLYYKQGSETEYAEITGRDQSGISSILSGDGVKIGLTSGGGDNNANDWFIFRNLKVTKLADNPDENITQTIELVKEYHTPVAAINGVLDNDTARIIATITYPEDTSQVDYDTTLVRWAVSKEPVTEEASGDISIILNENSSLLPLSAVADSNVFVTPMVVLIKDGIPSDVSFGESIEITDAVADAVAIDAKSSDPLLKAMRITLGGNDITDKLTRGNTTGFEKKSYVYNYRVTNPDADTKLDYSFTPNDANATVEVSFCKKSETSNLHRDETVGSYANNASLNIGNGANLLECKVTAEDGVTSKYYRINIDRKGSDDATLKSLIVNGNDILKSRESERTFEVRSLKERISISTITNHPNATVTVGSRNTTVDSKGMLNLTPGVNTINVNVVSESGNTVERYVIDAFYGDNVGTQLGSVKLFNGTVDKFTTQRVGKTVYTAHTEYKDTIVTVASLDSNASVTIEMPGTEAVTGTGIAKLYLSELSSKETNTATITIESSDEETAIYYLDIELDSYLSLSDIREYQSSGVHGSFPVFDKGNGTTYFSLVNASDNSKVVPNTGTTTYNKGIVIHPSSAGAMATLTYNLKSDALSQYKFTRFTSNIGIEGAMNKTGELPTATFYVAVDGVDVQILPEEEGDNGTQGKAYTASIQNDGQYNGPKFIDIDLSEAEKFSIKATRTGSNAAVHAGWGDPRLYYEPLKDPKLTDEAIENEEKITIINKEANTGDYPLDFEPVIRNPLTDNNDSIGSVRLEYDMDYYYTGSAITPDVDVWDGGEKLVAGVDYTVSYKNNKNAWVDTSLDRFKNKITGSYDSGKNNSKKPTIVITGKGKYIKKQNIFFNIIPSDIEKLVPESGRVLVKNGKSNPIPTIYCDGTRLKYGKDFQVFYAGANATVKGIGNYSGTVEFQIVEKNNNLKDVSKLSIKLKANNLQYNGEAVILNSEQLVVKDGKEELVAGQHYDVEYKNNDRAGKAIVVIYAKDTSRYIGSVAKVFNIGGKDLAKEIFKNTNKKLPDSEVFQGAACPISMKNMSKNNKAVIANSRINYTSDDANSILLKEGYDEHYTITYKNNNKTGTAQMILTGTGKDGVVGKVTFSYAIVAPSTGIKASLADCTVKVPYVKGGATPGIEVVYYNKNNDRVLLNKGADYTITYNKPTGGAARIKDLGATSALITFKGNYKGYANTYVDYTVIAKNIASAIIYTADVEIGKTVSSAPKVMLTDTNGKALVAKKDYTLSYSTDGGANWSEKWEKMNITDKTGLDGKLKVKAVAQKPYSGSVICNINIGEKGRNLSSVKAIPVKKSYTGEEIYLTKEEADSLLTMGKDKEAVPFIGKVKNGIALTGKAAGSEEDGYYILNYLNNTQKGKMTIILKGNGSYYGTKVLNINIAAKDMTNLKSPSNRKYGGR